jgi:hypothetical protein
LDPRELGEPESYLSRRSKRDPAKEIASTACGFVTAGTLMAALELHMIRST